MKDKFIGFIKKHKRKIYIILGLLVIISFAVTNNDTKQPKKQSITEFMNLVKTDKAKELKKVTIIEDSNTITYTYNKKEYEFQYPEYFISESPTFLNDLSKAHVQVKLQSSANSGLTKFRNVVGILFDIALIYIFIKLIGGFSGFEVKEIQNEKVTFDDIAGYESVKNELLEVVEFFKDPKEYKKYIEKAPNVLLVGPPGNGKTWLAKAVAGEANIPFFEISGSDIEDKYVGSGARRIEKLFKTVRKKAEETGGVILFIDEIDAFAGKREQRTVQETTQTINKFLTEVDGFSKDTKVVIIAATNLVSSLDEAVIRSGRFDRIVRVEKPNLNERKAVIELYLNKKKELVDEEVFKLDYAFVLAQQTEGFSNADFAKLVNTEASLIAKKHNSKIDIKVLREAFTKIIAGAESNRKVTEKTKKIVAYHEAGHATAQIMTSPNGYKGVAYITITPYGESLGHVSPISGEEHLKHVSDIENQVKVMLAGRAVEDKILNGDYTIGAIGDLQQANRALIAYVAKFGMSKEMENLYIENIDENKELVQKLTKQARERLYKETKILIEEHFDIVEKIAEYLLNNPSIEQYELPELLLGTSYENKFELNKSLFLEKVVSKKEDESIEENNQVH